MLKKLLTGVLLLLLILTIAGCSRTYNADQNNSNSSNTSDSTQNSNSTDTNLATSTSESGKSAIVAKSGNIVSNSEKEELLNDIDKEMDLLLSDLNNLDEIPEADLDLNQ
jgi:outer membrane biogenesis lipoprotein LolB